MTTNSLLPTSIQHLAAGEVLLVVASILAAFLPLGEKLDAPPPEHDEQSHKRQVASQFVKYGPQLGSFLALWAIFLCFLYAWANKSGILQASLVLLFLGVIIFILVILVSLYIAFIPPVETEYEKVADQDMARLLDYKKKKP
jgi:uncharacterized membrane protein